MLKIGFFADTHYAPGIEAACGTRLCSRSADKLRGMLRCFAGRGVDCIVNLGDLVNGQENETLDRAALEELLELLGAAPAPVYHVIGNHDAYALPKTAVVPGCHGPAGAVGEFVLDGITFLILDGCFNSAGEAYDEIPPSAHNWRDAAISPAGLDWLEKRLSAAPGEVVILCHPVIAPRTRADGSRNPHVLVNAAEVRALLEASGRVRQVFCGHEHCGYETEERGITYTGLPALCEGESARGMIAQPSASGWRKELVLLSPDEYEVVCGRSTRVN